LLKPNILLANFHNTAVGEVPGWGLLALCFTTCYK
jgi:hypothetical protein